MSATKFIRVPFATTGDRVAIPDVVEGDGSISWPQGFGPKYALDPTDPDALRVPRGETNQYLYDLSANVRAWQVGGFPEWITSAQNGGTPVSYPLASYCRHNGSGTWRVYRAKINNASLEPGVGAWATEWDEVTAGSGAPLIAANNLSDLASVTTARTNLGLGSMALQNSGNFLPVSAPNYTGGMTGAGGLRVDGLTSGNVDAVAALAIDWSLADAHTKSISANSVFTFANIPSGRFSLACLKLTISSSATITWPASVQWPNGVAPTFSNGIHVITFVTFDGGTTVQGIIGGRNFA